MVKIELRPAQQRLIDRAWTRIAQKSENLDRRDDFQPCFVCGLPVDTKRAHMIRVIEGGSHAAENGDAIDPAGDMLWHPVGPECFRRQPALRRALTEDLESLEREAEFQTNGEVP